MKDEKRQVAVLGNRLVTATYDLNIGSKKLLLLAISKLDSRKYHQSYEIEITASEWQNAYGLSKDPYRTLKKAVLDLKEAASVKLKEVEIAGSLYPVAYVDWIITAGYNDGGGKVGIEIHPKIRQHLVYALHELGYSKIYLLNIAKLRSTRSVKLYEQLAKFSSTGFYIVSVDNLRELLNAPESMLYGAFKRDIVDRAVKDIKGNSNYNVSYTAIKKGRSVNQLKFKFTEREQLDLF